MRHYLAIAGRFGLLAALLLTVVLVALIVGAMPLAWGEEAEERSSLPAAPAPEPESPRSSRPPAAARGGMDGPSRSTTAVA